MKRIRARRFAAVLTFFLLWALVEHAARFFTNPLEQAWPSVVEDRKAVEGTITTAFVGASLFRNGIIPAAFDEVAGGQSFNDSTSGQTIALTEYALGDIAEANPLKLLVVDVSVNRLIKESDEGGRIAKYAALSQMLSWRARLNLLKNAFTLDELPMTVLTSARDQLHFFWGTLSDRLNPGYIKAYLRHGYVPDPLYPAGSMGYTPDTGTNPEGGVPFSEPDGETERVSEENLASLARIIAFCKQRGITPVLLSMPTTDTCLLYFDGYDALQAPVRTLAEREGALYLDFNLSRFRNTLTDADFLDERHMNASGAERFTPYLAEVLAKALAGEDVSDRFYASWAEAAAAVGRVSSVELDVTEIDGGAALRAYSLEGTGVTPAYRFSIRPLGAPEDESRALESSGDTCLVAALEPGAYTVRVEAFSDSDSPCDAYREQDIQID